MSTIERRQAEVARASRRIRRVVGEELRGSRIAAGLSQAAIAEAAGVSKAEVSRVEHGLAPWLSIHELSRLAMPLGLTVSVRLYPAGPPIRDRAQQALLARFRAKLAPSLRWQPEAPIPIGGDPRAWDAVVHGAGWRVAVDAESRIHDLQALERRVTLKQRDDGAVPVVLLVNDTRLNRTVLASEREWLRPLLPLDTRTVLGALRRGRFPGGSGIVVL